MASFWDRFYAMKRVQMALFPTKSNQSNYRGIKPEQVVEQIEQYIKVQPPFELFVKPSTLPNAGLGLFIKPVKDIPSGTVVALYPGLIYDQMDPIFFASINNRYIIRRKNGQFIDGKHCGLSAYMYKSSWNREWTWYRVKYDRSWMVLREPGPVASWNVGQLINNGNEYNNVVYNEFVIEENWKKEWREYIPNVPYTPETSAIHGMALVTCIELVKGVEQELLATYDSITD
ncbi:SET domain-containing protein 9 [Terramyces sp. JEL0728]|nr:SET domain-containing protein 9 [Terramyces sp. JEL0728]